MKLGCTFSRGFGPKHFLGTHHGKKSIDKQHSTSINNGLPQNITGIGIGRKKDNKKPLIKIEKVDDRIVREMGQNLHNDKEDSTKGHAEDPKRNTLSKVHRNNTEGSEGQNTVKKVCGEMLKGQNSNDICKVSRKEVPMNFKSTDDDDASLTFKDLKNTQKTSDDSESSSQASDSKDSESTHSNCTTVVYLKCFEELLERL